MMSSNKGSVAGKKGGVVVILPTVKEFNSQEGDALVVSRSPSPGEENDFQAGGSTYPVDLLGVSWGSYLHSTPPSRSDGLEVSEERSPENGTGKEKYSPTPGSFGAAAKASGTGGSASKHKEPHPLLVQMGELMKEIVRSKEELANNGLDTSLSSLSDLSLESQYNLLQMTMKGKPNTNQALTDFGVLENTIKYLREVVKHLVEQGRRSGKQAHFLQNTARKLNENHQKTLNEQKSIQQVIREDRAMLEAERQEREKEKTALLAAKVDLKRMLHEAEMKLKDREIATRRMDSPHTVAKEQSQRIDLSKTKKQQSHLEKTFTTQMRDMRSLQQAHDQTRSELLAAKEQVTKLQRRIAKQVHDIKSSEAAMSNRFEVSRGVQMNPQLSLEREKKRKTYQGISQAQISATLQNITIAHRNLCRDIERMQRKLSQQQTVGLRVSRQMDDSHKELLGTNSLIRQHSKTLKRGQTDQLHTHEDKLPKLQTKSIIQKKRMIKDNFSLPQIELPQHTVLMQQVPMTKPPYQFSKDELHTLADFHTHKSATEVTEWLQTQGKLE